MNLIGSGSSSDPYLLYSQDDLKDMKNYPTDVNFKLANDIEITDEEWTPLYKHLPFRGVLDGDGYSIKGLRSTTFGEEDGFFQSIHSATIKRIKFEDVYVEGHESRTGILVGHGIFNNTFEDVYIQGHFKSVSGVLHSSFIGFCNNPSTNTYLRCHTEVTFERHSSESSTHCYNFASWSRGDKFIDCYSNSSFINEKGEKRTDDRLGHFVYGSDGTFKSCYFNEDNSLYFNSRKKIEDDERDTTSNVLVGYKTEDFTEKDNFPIWDKRYWDFSGDSPKLTFFKNETRRENMMGEGTEENPYIITHPDHLYELRNDTSAYYKLGNDINFHDSNDKFYETQNFTFYGVFDGNGHTIKNLVIDKRTQKLNLNFRDLDPDVHCGLIPTLGEGGLIKNLGLQNVNINSLDDSNSAESGRYTGSICAIMLPDSQIERCWVDGFFKTNGGNNANNEGGIIGGNGRVNGEGRRVKDVYSKLNSVNLSCGFARSLLGSVIYFENCYNDGVMDRQSNSIHSGISPRGVINSYYNSDNTPIPDDRWSESGTPLTSEEMLMRESYEGFDFENTWTFIEGNTPFLNVFPIVVDRIGTRVISSFSKGIHSDTMVYTVRQKVKELTLSSEMPKITSSVDADLISKRIIKAISHSKKINSEVDFQLLLGNVKMILVESFSGKIESNVNSESILSKLAEIIVSSVFDVIESDLYTEKNSNKNSNSKLNMIESKSSKISVFKTFITSKVKDVYANSFKGVRSYLVYLVSTVGNSFSQNKVGVIKGVTSSVSNITQNVGKKLTISFYSSFSKIKAKSIKNIIKRGYSWSKRVLSKLTKDKFASPNRGMRYYATVKYTEMNHKIKANYKRRG